MAAKRAPRYKEAPELVRNFQLQERDFNIVRLIYDYRFLNSEQIAALTAGSNQVILRRLQKLFHHGYLERPISQIVFSNALFGHQKMVYGLGSKGADLLAWVLKIDKGNLIWKEKSREVRERYLQHTLMISNFRACLDLSLRNMSETEMPFWIREKAPELKDNVRFLQKNGRRRRLPVNPDGFFALKSPNKKAHFFFEADRSTMTNTRFLNKLRAYWLWWKQGRANQKLGVKDFRVLTLTKSKQRRDNLMWVAQAADDRQKGSSMFWFASEQDISLHTPKTVFHKIWTTASTKDHEMHTLLE